MSAKSVLHVELINGLFWIQNDLMGIRACASIIILPIRYSTKIIWYFIFPFDLCVDVTESCKTHQPSNHSAMRSSQSRQLNQNCTGLLWKTTTNAIKWNFERKQIEKKETNRNHTQLHSATKARKIATGEHVFFSSFLFGSKNASDLNNFVANERSVCAYRLCRFRCYKRWQSF